MDAFLPVSQYYADYMPGYLGLPASKMRLAPLGINMDGFTAKPRERGGPWDYEHQGVIGAVGGLLESGRMKLYCVDSFDSASWSNASLPLEARARELAARRTSRADIRSQRS